MICREYSILPVEPALNSAKKTIQVQIPNVSGTQMDENFLQIKATSYNKTLEYIDQPIKAPSHIKEASIVSFSLSEVTNLEIFKNSLRSERRAIEIKDKPSYVNDYSTYKGVILSLISSLPNRIILNTNDYLTDIINDIATYKNKIQALGTSIYGLCVSQNPKVEDLFNYTIDTNVLVEQIQILKNNSVDLILDMDAICAPTENITNTYASQIWLLDTLCQISSIGLTNVYVNMDSYSNVYSILTYLFITRNSGVLNSYNFTKDTNVNIYVSENIKEYFVTVIHKDDSDDNILVQVSAPYSSPANLIRFITNQTYQGICGMTFGELTFDGSKDGYPIQIKTRQKNNRFSASTVQANTEILSTNGTFSFVVSRMSVTILKIPKSMNGGNLMKGGAYFENINKSDEKNTIVTIQPNPLRDEYDSVPTTMNLRDFQKKYQSEL
uniref:Uncharacterized protein n=1 Tax=viral metagenome TaxID=1070528 RepID=A0A6C0D9V3_9ZZZZ